MSLQCHCQLLLKGHWDWEKFSISEREKISVISSRRTKKKDLGNCGLLNHSSVLAQMMEQLFVKNISRYIKDQKVTRSN